MSSHQCLASIPTVQNNHTLDLAIKTQYLTVSVNLLKMQFVSFLLSFSITDFALATDTFETTHHLCLIFCTGNMHYVMSAMSISRNRHI